MNSWYLLFLALTVTACLLPAKQDGKGVEAEPNVVQPGDEIMLGKNVEWYIARLASEHAHERDEALTWLLAHPEVSRPALIELVKAGQPNPRTLGAIYLLGRMVEEADVPLLATVLTRADPRFIWESAQALGHHNSPLAFDALLSVLWHGNAQVVSAAALALGVRGDQTARKPLEQLLEHAEETVRYRTVYALRLLGITPSATLLRMHLERETSVEVRQIIEDALR